MANEAAEAVGKSLKIIDEIWNEASLSLLIRLQAGLPITQLPELSEASAQARQGRGKSWLRRLERIDHRLLPEELALTLELARFHAGRWSREGDWYWLVCDPAGIGFYSLFAPAAYGGGFTLGLLTSYLARFRFERPGDADRYAALLRDYARLVAQMRERTEGQASRGIVMPAAQIAQVIELLNRLAKGAGPALIPAADRLASADRDRIGQIVERELQPAFQALTNLLGGSAYRRAAPSAVGIAQYQGGAAVYEELVRFHTTLPLGPAEIHQAGLRRMQEVTQQMSRLLEEVGFHGSPAEYLTKVGTDSRWRAADPDEISAFFQRYIDRLEPHVADLFGFRPRAPYGVAALPEAQSGSMTFGFYDAPSEGREAGCYRFNAANLSRNPLANIAALTYHELVPGHHFHVASQLENEALHPLRQNSFCNAFNEGWAEYAAALAGEIGMYREPEERFGRLMMDAFLTSRLVVDTGLNALGWDLDRARAYMREHSFLPEREIESETLRYSCDVPGQSLAYKLGDEFLMRQREKMKAGLGERFSLKLFHDTVLRPGGLPLAVVARQVEAAINEAC